jgi:O-succinylbenzoate synthase
MRYSFQFWQYCHPFRQPLHTRYGVWRERHGLIVQLKDENGRSGQGEIAPIPWFGSETLEEAIAFCHELPAEISDDLISTIPAHLPACQFAFESALANDSPPPSRLFYSRLLPAGEAALTRWQSLYDRGCRTFKWKIGVYPIAQELVTFASLVQSLPPDSQLRLDANGGLNWQDAVRLLSACERYTQTGAAVEYLEQPLPPDAFKTLLRLSYDYPTPIALDESVTTLDQIQDCYEQSWGGIVVIKPAITGSPAGLRHFLQNHPLDAVFSTVFETEIGRQAGLRLAAELGNPNRAVGYDGDWYCFDYFGAACDRGSVTA